MGVWGRSKEREMMQDATTSKSEREMTLILMSSSAGGALMAFCENGKQGLRSQPQEPGRQVAAIFLLKVLNSMPNLLGSVAGSDPSLLGRG